MRTMMYTTALGLLLWAADPATGQPRPGGPRPKGPDATDSKRLLEQLDKLDARLKELEDRLPRAKGPERPGPKGAPGRADPFSRGFGRRPGFGGPGFGRPPAGASRGQVIPDDIGRRLDRIIAELEQLRKDVGVPRR
jgi:hypothetical protein